LAGNLRVRGSNPGGSSQPWTPGCQKITSDSQPKTACLLMNNKFARCFLKDSKKHVLWLARQGWVSNSPAG